jgi:CheY-like chemotaxis protein
MTRPNNILLAEDDADDRALFQEAIALVDPAIKVLTVDNGETLMKYLRESVVFPDCIFLDLNMPKKNGKECLAEIRQDQKTMSIPVIIYTTSVNARDIDDTFHKGASCFIRKPGTFSELKELLYNYITSRFSESDPQVMKHKFVLNLR